MGRVAAVFPNRSSMSTFRLRHSLPERPRWGAKPKLCSQLDHPTTQQIGSATDLRSLRSKSRKQVPREPYSLTKFTGFEKAWSTKIRRQARVKAKYTGLQPECPRTSPFWDMVGPLRSFSIKRWRREGDSNPRYGFPYTHFPGVRLQPLGHLSRVPAACILRCTLTGTGAS